MCRDICGQTGHAEINAIRLAGKKAKGSTVYMEGHTYCCEACKKAMAAVGVENIVFGPPPGTSADGPRYKAIGNSMAVPVMAWIGHRIQEGLRQN